MASDQPRRRPKHLDYREGDVFAVPLRSTGFGIGVVARVSPKKRVLLTYLFGPRCAEVPAFVDVSTLRRHDAVAVLRTGDLHLIEGSWPVIGRLDPWRREDWPMPAFGRFDPISGRAFEVRYSDTDPLRVVAETRIDPALVGALESDGLHGAGSTEIVLTRLLDAPA